MARFSKKTSMLLRNYWREQCGAAAAEFALIVTLLTVPVLNMVDLAIYAWDKVQLDYAAQAAAQAAWATCSSPVNLPATPGSYAKCPAMPTTMGQVVASTPLGADVTISATQEGYYCVTTGTPSSLVLVAAATATPPADCSGAGGSASDLPGDYVLITASYTYSALFPSASVASLLTSPIVRTAWMRLN